MKRRKIIAGIVTALMAENLFAGYPAFVEVEYAAVKQDKEEIFGGQPMKELIGDKKSEIIFKIGYTSENYDSGHIKSKGYIFGWKADVNDEIGFGLGGELGRSFASIPSLGWFIGGQIGYGWQPVKGDVKILSTNATKYGYIIGRPIKHGRFRVDMMKDTDILRSDLTLGLIYSPLKNLSVGIKYRFSYAVYDFEYVGVDNVYSAYTKTVCSNQAVVGLTFHF